MLAPFSDAVIVAVVLAVTTDVFTVNAALVAPPATVTLAGTTAKVEFDERAMVSPAAGAGLLRVIVPVELAPPTTDPGFSFSIEMRGALTLSFAVTTAPFNVAESAAAVVVATGDVTIVKVADVVPAGIVT